MGLIAFLVDLVDTHPVGNDLVSELAVFGSNLFGCLVIIFGLRVAVLIVADVLGLLLCL